MPTYTVHEPPPRKNESVVNPERFVFVRDGFHFWAFLLPPLWFIAKRLWLALILYMIVAVGLAYAMSWAKVPATGRFIAEFMFMLVVGFEAGTIQRWSLRKWKMLGFVVAEDEELAERRFFAAWKQGGSGAAKLVEPAPVYAAPVLRGPPSSSDVIGLFPEPGNSSLGTSR
jgi:Zn-dependent protease with chaperone function